MTSGMETRYLIPILTLVSSNAMGDVSLFDGAYRRIDADHEGLSRHYSSRRLERGLFGVGWCHPLENRLVRKSRVLILHDCRSPLPIEYLERDGQATASHDPEDKLIRRGALWERRVRGRLLETYEAQGTLTLYLEGGRAWTRAASRDGRLRARTVDGAELVIDLDPRTGLARWAQDGRGRRVHYIYENGSLLGTRSPSGRTFQYDLSNTGDIVQAKDGSFATESIVYDHERDRVLRVSRAGGCALEVTYQKSGATIKAQARRKCPSRLARDLSGEKK